MGYRVTPNTLRWWHTYTFWVETTDSLLSVRWWAAYALTPLVVLACLVLFFLLLGQRMGGLPFWPSFVIAYSNWLLLGAFIYLAAFAIWIADGARSFSYDVGDMIDSWPVRGTDLSLLFAGLVLLVVLTATFFGVWALVWWLGQFVPQCPGVGPMVLSPDSYIWPALRSLAECLLPSTPSPSLWWTLAISGPLTVLIIVISGVTSWLEDAFPQGPSELLSRLWREGGAMGLVAGRRSALSFMVWGNSVPQSATP
jgi:hypothetical protein